MAQGARAHAGPHLGAGVHEDEVLVVQPQEAGPRQGLLAHAQHHVDGVAEEGQLAHALWGGRAGDTYGGSSGRWGPATCPSWPLGQVRGTEGGGAFLAPSALSPCPSGAS